MPKRSNSFQKLIHLIEKQLADGKAKIVESKLLKDIITGQKREVDIYIESKINNHKVGIAIECRNHKRKAGVEWIDQLIGKYDNLPVHKVVAVSSSGFTNSAYEKAELSKIVLITLDKAIEEDWVRVVNKVDSVIILLVRFLRKGVFYNSDLKEANSSKVKVLIGDKFKIKSGNSNKDIDTLEDLVNDFLSSSDFSDQLKKEFINKFDEKTMSFEKNYNSARASYDFEKYNFVLRDKDGGRQKLKKVFFEYSFKVDKVTVPTKKFSYNQNQVVSITKKVDELNVIVSISENKDEGPMLGVFVEADYSDGKKGAAEIISKDFPIKGDPLKVIGYYFG